MKAKVAQVVDAQFPTCEICGGVIRRPCTIAYKHVKTGETKGKVACSRCYGVWVCLTQLVLEGAIEVIPEPGEATITDLTANGVI